MKGTVTIEKTFDKTSGFCKELDEGDFKEFFTEEGEYLDNLVEILQEHGKSGEGFTVTYTVIVEA